MWHENMSAVEAAELIERYLEGRSLYPQEWNDFVETPQVNPFVECYRKKCDELDPLVNRPGEPDPRTVEQLKAIVVVLKSGEN
jgi:hypothetical protein